MLDVVQHRQHELVQPGEGQLCLGLKPGRAEDPHTVRFRVPDRGRQQDGFSDAGFTPHQQRRAALGNPVDQPFEPGQLLLAANNRVPGGVVGSAR